ncbi:MAG TPA: ABC transporter ATP-binding protein [Candidatus Nanoarchaeia archaeon]|nr:ABC transporter ATP-binding protein [Candidatus Nanoarchaeia archaeon]
MPSLIELQNVTQIFSKRSVLENVNLTINYDDFVGIIGASGSGKTTLLRIILGIYTPPLGKIIANSASLQHTIGFASQDDAFYPRLTVLENMFYFGELYGISKTILNQRIPYLLQLVKLEDAGEATARNLSGGMKRRLGIALALIHDPKVLILDEPTAGLDIVLQRHIWKIINDIRSLGKTIIVSTHDLDALQEHCTSFIFIHQKSVYSGASVKQLISRYRGNLSKLFEAYVQ